MTLVIFQENLKKMNNISGYILAGGGSTRMGRPKQSLALGDRRLADIAHDNLRSICSEVSIVVKEPLIDPPDRQIYDVVPDGETADGPLVAIYTALMDTATEWIFVLACDLPFATPELVACLASECADEFDAIIPIQPDGRPQPLCGLYRRSTCLPIAEKALREGKRSPMAMLEKVSTRYIEFSRLEHLSGSMDLFTNVNTPEDYEKAVRSVGSGSETNSIR